MNYFECQEFFKAQYPDKKVECTFDGKCHRFLECVLTDGLPNIMHHVEYNKCCVTVEGMAPLYIPIIPHRMNVCWADAKQFVALMNDVHLVDNDLQVFSEIKDQPEYDIRMGEYMKASGLTQENIEKKIQDYEVKKSNLVVREV